MHNSYIFLYYLKEVLKMKFEISFTKIFGIIILLINIMAAIGAILRLLVSFSLDTVVLLLISFSCIIIMLNTLKYI